MPEVNVANSQLHQSFPRLIQKRLDSLDGINLARQAGQDRRLIPAAAADLQHPAFRTNIQIPRHQRDDIRLADRLPMPNRRRPVIVRLIAPLGREETLARNAPQRGEHPLVVDPALDDLLADHPFQRRYRKFVTHAYSYIIECNS